MKIRRKGSDVWLSSSSWIEIETKKGNELINAEFIQSIKINP